MIVLIIFKILLAIFSLFFITLLLIRIRDSIFIKVPFVPVRKRAILAIIKCLNLSNGSILYDIGCGDGRVLLSATALFPNIRTIGIEKGIYPYIISFFKTMGKPIKILYADYKNILIKDATHIFCYLSNEDMNKIGRKVKNECKDGTVIVSCDFEIPNLTPFKIVTLDNNDKLAKTLFVYIK